MALSFTAGPIMAIQLEFVRKTVIVFQLIIISIFLNAQSNCAFDTHWVPYKLRNGNFVYVDSATMKPITGKEWDGIAFFNNQSGYAPAATKDKWGLINRKEEFILAPEYDMIDIQFGMILLWKKDKLSIRDIEQREIFPWEEDVEYYRITRQDQNFIGLRKKVKKSTTIELINKQGKVIIPFGEYEDFVMFPLSRGYMGVKKNGKWGFVDTTGATTVPCIYDNIYLSRIDNWIVVQKEGKWGYIDSVNNIKIPLEYEACGIFSDSMANVKKNGKWSYIDKNNRLIMTVDHDVAYSMQNGIGIVRSGKKYGAIDMSGKLVIPLEYDDIERAGSTRLYYKVNDLYGLMDFSGKKLTPAEFSSVTFFTEGLSKVTKTEEYNKLKATFSKFNARVEWAFIDSNGTVIIPYFDYRVLDNVWKFHEWMRTKYTLIDDFECGFNSVVKITYLTQLMMTQTDRKLIAYFDRSGRLYCDCKIKD